MTSKRLWVLEGPDGGGKSTLAAGLAAGGARVVHLGPFPRVTHGLGRLYLEAMLPALQGLSDVVLDRSWLSEPIYADAFRQGQTRLTGAELRMLERVAARCQTTVVRCLPPLATCLATFKQRQGSEYLKCEEQLTQVWTRYAATLATSLPVVDFNYQSSEGLPAHADTPMTRPHPLAVASAGYLDAPVLLVGEEFSEVGEYDCLQQYPFVSFAGGGCAGWLTSQLAAAGVAERALLWANADGNLGELLVHARPRLVAALGKVAAEEVESHGYRDGVKLVFVDHPQHYKRFKFNQPYPLLAALAEVL